MYILWISECCVVNKIHLTFKNIVHCILFSKLRNTQLLIIHFSEPNSLKHHFGYGIDASILAKDFGILKKILQTDPLFSKYYRNTLIIGPDVTNPRVQDLLTIESDIYLRE